MRHSVQDDELLVMLVLCLTSRLDGNLSPRA